MLRYTRFITPSFTTSKGWRYEMGKPCLRGFFEVAYAKLEALLTELLKTEVHIVSMPELRTNQEAPMIGKIR